MEIVQAVVSWLKPVVLDIRMSSIAVEVIKEATGMVTKMNADRGSTLL